MDYSAIESWYQEQISIANLYNKEYENNLLSTNVSNVNETLLRIHKAPEYQDLLNFQSSFKKLSTQFKSRLLALINKYNLTIKENDFSNFYIVRLTVITYLALNQQYSYKLPYGDDPEKYNSRKNVIMAKLKKESKILFLIMGTMPKDSLVFFKSQCQEVLVNDKIFHSVSRNKRKVTKLKNSMIDEFIECIVIDSYIDDYKDTIRITTKANQTFKKEKSKFLDQCQ